MPLKHSPPTVRAPPARTKPPPGASSTSSVAAPPGTIPAALLKQARASGKVRAGTPPICYLARPLLTLCLVLYPPAQLNLTSRGLTELPESVLRINLDAGAGGTIDFSAAGAERWWEQVPLAQLVLASNALAALPAELPGLLPALTLLDVHDNPLPALPDTLPKLRELAVLHASHCRLAALPPALGDCGRLTTLLLDHNRLTALPDSLAQLSQLETLVWKEKDVVCLGGWV